ncbi:MAG: DinB family protein [Bacteroidetes bacterium]|nr:MAG: DinB family protein [Bacteroidota bacterium]
MNSQNFRETLLQQIKKNHFDFVEYINTLTEEQFLSSKNQKWTAGQQLEHLVISIKTFANGITDKSTLLAKFGKLTRLRLDYENIVKDYKNVLSNGGKAPEFFLPKNVELAQKDNLIKDIGKYIERLENNFLQYTDDEIDTIAIPHPLLSLISIGEMCHILTYHVLHHQLQIKENLEN